jgi:hypothetical protein
MHNIPTPLIGSDPVRRRVASVPAGLVDSKVVENRTAHTIGIRIKTDKAQKLLIIPPFGRRIFSRTELNSLECEDWERLRLIVREDHHQIRRAGAVLGDAVNYLLGGALLALLGAPVRGLWESTWFWGLLVSFVLLITLVSVPGLWTLFLNFVSASFIYVVVGAIGFGLPIVLFDSQRTIMQLGLADWLTIACIGTFATLPAVLFYLFYGQGLRTLRTNLIRDIIRIDPNVRTVDEAEERYGKLIDDTVGTRHGHIPFTGHVMVLITTLLLTLGWSCILPIERAEALRSLVALASSPLIFGFLGAYIFSVNLAFLRYERADINAKTYTCMTVRLLLTLILAWVLGWLLLPPAGAAPLRWAEAALAVLAFVIGCLPESAWVMGRMLIQRLRRLHPGLALPGRYRMLRELEGMSLHDQARLFGEGIENVSHLVNYPLVDLMLRTRIPTQHLLDLVDQALLSLYVGPTSWPGASAPNDQALQILHAYGLRTATQLERAKAAAMAGGADDHAQFLGLLGPDSAAAPQQPKRLRLIIDTLRTEEQMAYLRCWHNVHQQIDRVYTIDDFNAPGKKHDV